MFSLICLMLLSHSIFVTSTEYNNPCDDNASKPKSIFILAGQSNMAGRGGVDGENWFVPPESQPNPQILRLNAELTWEEAVEPLHRDIDVGKPAGIGPGMAFANSVLKRDPSLGVIGLVPCAKGGTSIKEWAPGQYLYIRMLSRAQAALRAGGGEIRAILWYQGESDTTKQAYALAYKGRFEELFARLRSDLQMPNLPIIEVVIESADVGGKYLDTVRAAQKEINIPNMKRVDSMGLELKSDHVHLAIQGEVKLGKMLAGAFLN